MSSVTLDNNIKDTIISPNALIIIDKKNNDLYIRNDFDTNNIDHRFIGTFLEVNNPNITITISISIEEINTRSTRANPVPPVSGPIQIQLPRTYIKYILNSSIHYGNDCGLTAERFTLADPTWPDEKDPVLVVKSTGQKVNNSEEDNTTIAKQSYDINTIDNNADPLLKESFYIIQTFNVGNKQDYPPNWQRNTAGLPEEKNFKFCKYKSGANMGNTRCNKSGCKFLLEEWTQYHVAYVFGKFTIDSVNIYLTCESDSSDLTRLAPKFALYSSNVDYTYNISVHSTTMTIQQNLTTFHDTFAAYFGNACKTIVVHGIQSSQTPSTSPDDPPLKKQKRGGGYCKSKRIIKKMRKNRMKTSKRR